jgi:hypothetical protein
MARVQGRPGLEGLRPVQIGPEQPIRRCRTTLSRGMSRTARLAPVGDWSSPENTPSGIL